MKPALKMIGFDETKSNFYFVYLFIFILYMFIFCYYFLVIIIFSIFGLFPTVFNLNLRLAGCAGAYHSSLWAGSRGDPEQGTTIRANTHTEGQFRVFH